MKFKLVLLTLFLITSQSCMSQSNEKVLSVIIEKEAGKLLEDSRFHAVSIAVFDSGKSYLGHFGELDKNFNNKPTDKTLYEIASVTKTMTGYLVAGAISEKKLDLESTVYDILGKEFNNLEYKGEPVRIRHLITHTSGLPLNITGVSELYQNPTKANYSQAQKTLTQYSKEDMLSEIKSLELKQRPGTEYSYSNVAPNLLAHILETVYGKDFEQLLEEKLLIPAQMTNTHINLDPSQKEFLANGYNGSNELMPNFKEPINLWGAAGRIKTSSKDMLAYIKWQLDNENPIVKMSHMQLFHDVENIWIGYFWEVIKNANSSHIEHHGGIYGSQNWLIILPEQDIGISIIVNSSFREANQIIKNTAHRILEKLH